MIFFERAFRPFFVGGLVFSIVAMAAWWWQYPSIGQPLGDVSWWVWHGHEMIFGYGLAIVSGFLLTAAMNWSRMDSASGWALAWLFVCWLLARVGFLSGASLPWIALFDLAFNLGLIAHFAWPVWKKRLNAQYGLLALFVAIAGANIAFYSSLLHYQAWLSPHQALLLGLFLVLTVNLTMMRRLIPFFTEKTLALTALKNDDWLDKSVLGGFVLMGGLVVFAPNSIGLTLLALPLLALLLLRQWRWYHPGIWRQVLLWPLHLAHACIALGIALYGLVGLSWVAPTQAMHALAFGGMGLLCASMLARISLGHTQRNVFEPPKGLIWVFIFIALAAGFRVLMPLIYANASLLWMQLSQLSWLAAFMLLLALYVRILTLPAPKPRAGVLL
ncbi:MAG: NnrS family protein [Thiomicrospira sp.]|jgi:uncharacterized protein involved in response to NO|nr:NnrS family protein [Thiomicrospira sp.]